MSLLLDALKQAEKSKKEKAGSDAAIDVETMRLDPPPDRDDEMKPAAQGDDFEMEPFDNDDDTSDYSLRDEEGAASGAHAAGGADTHPHHHPGELRLSPEESQSLSMDLEQIAEELAQEPPPRQPTGDGIKTGAHQMLGSGSITMPSVKNVQRSMDDFYGGSTGVLSQPEEAPPDETEGAGGSFESTGSATRPSQHAARSVFDAKQGRSGSRTTVWLAVGAVVIALGLGGGYFYLTLGGVQPVSPRVARAPQPVLPARPAPAEAPPAGQDSALAARGAIDLAAPTPAEEEQELALATQVAVESGAPAATGMTAAGAPEPAQPESIAQAPVPMETPAQAPAVAPVRPAPEPVAPIRIKRRSTTDRQFAALKDAYAAFRNGRYIDAETAYRKVLRARPNNRDALIGLAAIAVQDGRTADAEQHYLHVLQLNPQDRVALAAMTALQGAVDPVANESRLKILLDKDPQAGYLHFTLGNVYAAQARWAEAQQAYFNAWRTDAENGDYQFNLAVALEHLGQPQPALRFYRGALQAAAGRPANFDRAAVERRIEVLSARGGRDA